MLILLWLTIKSFNYFQNVQIIISEINMNQKTKVTMLSISFLILISIGISFYLFLQLSILEEEIIQKKEDRVVIETYLSFLPSDKIINTPAYAVIETSKDSYDINDQHYSYKSDEGFMLISDSKNWNEIKLKALYNELKLNKHGEEFELLFKIIVHAEPDTNASGMHERTSEQLSLYFDFPAFPSTSMINFTRNMGTIHLYNGDKLTEVSQYAHTLSHEYGHHFTFYHMFKDNQLMNSEYEKIRNIQEHDVYYEISENYNHYLQNHMWYLFEIAAEDYVQLMGSPLTKNIVHYSDVYQRLYGNKTNLNLNSYNGYGQENMLIPLADEVDGLSEYFYKFISLEPNQSPYLKKSFDLSIRSGSTYHESTNGPLNFTHYKISWDDVYKYEEAIYTLISMDEDGSNIYPLKTVYPDDDTIAYIGTVSYEGGGYIHWNYDDIDKGTKIFIVTAVLPDGTIFKSNPLTYRFN